MAFGPQVIMSGGLHCEAPNGAPLGGVHSGLFRPPLSPSTSSSAYLARSTGSLCSDSTTPASNVKRKRLRAMDTTPRNGWAVSADVNMEDEMDNRPDSGTRISGGREIRYTLAGQIETPSGALQKQMGGMEDSTYSDVDYRRALGSKRPHADLDSPLSRHTMADSRRDVPQVDGWSRIALNTIGGVMGKVWQFCTAGAFRGFYAGPGVGYAIGTESSQNGQTWCNEHDVPTLPVDSCSPVPGGFPESDYAPFYYERETPESTPPPAAKRRQIFDGNTNDELRKNWVIVNDSPDKSRSSFASRTMRQIAQPQTRPVLNRLISKPVSRLSAPGFARQSSSRISHAGAPALSNREPASFANPRSPFAVQPPATPSRLPVPSRPHTPALFSPTRLSQQPSRIPSPNVRPNSSQTRGHRRTQSTASNASAASAATGRLRRCEGSVHDLVEERSPRLDPEAKKLAARRMHEEREADARINDFNARLKEMIRQGKEALGSSIEIEGDGDGDGYWDDE
ncbi:uncharacterized protein BCR38DRAFT_457122 [Pseudomassariella vexata]|uniref:Uncharacterized protein n=1 Tax=Pseudomassariella vexata TaxID=1141098 RepID=A0A1Y2DZS5_9PEZI|nr:uncharacterized protein BCR38DRAFT_457122 [Pseudomassariella vexata]ORY64792.1 hypothetical protein BCR38DRAFT_457122 [Pseudomassariella vexata]